MMGCMDGIDLTLAPAHTMVHGGRGRQGAAICRGGSRRGGGTGAAAASLGCGIATILLLLVMISGTADPVGIPIPLLGTAAAFMAIMLGFVAWAQLRGTGKAMTYAAAERVLLGLSGPVAVTCLTMYAMSLGG